MLFIFLEEKYNIYSIRVSLKFILLVADWAGFRFQSSLLQSKQGFLLLPSPWGKFSLTSLIPVLSICLFTQKTFSWTWFFQEESYCTFVNISLKMVGSCWWIFILYSFLVLGRKPLFFRWYQFEVGNLKLRDFYILGIYL